MKKIIFLLCLSISGVMVAQEKTYHQEVLEYFVINGTANQYSNATTGLFDLLKKQYAGSNVPASVWSELEGESSKAVERVLNMLVSAYRGSYSQQNIQEMSAFYSTPTGRQILTDRSGMTAEQQNEAAAFYNTATGQTILDSEQKIGKNISEISEIWSRDLYREMVDKLAEKGYSI